MHNFINLILGLLTGLLAALVVQDIYTWFVVPLGAPILEFWHVYGLLLFKGLMIYSLKPQKETTSEQDTGAVLSFAIMLLIAWGLGGFASWMM